MENDGDRVGVRAVFGSHNTVVLKITSTEWREKEDCVDGGRAETRIRWKSTATFPPSSPVLKTFIERSNYNADRRRARVTELAF